MSYNPGGYHFYTPAASTTAPAGNQQQFNASTSAPQFFNPMAQPPAMAQPPQPQPQQTYGGYGLENQFANMSLAPPPQPQTYGAPPAYYNPSATTTAPPLGPPPTMQEIQQGAYQASPPPTAYPPMPTTFGVPPPSIPQQSMQQPQPPTTENVGAFPPAVAQTYLAPPPTAPQLARPTVGLFDVSTESGAGAAFQGAGAPQQDKRATPSNKIDPNQIPSPAKRKFPDFYQKKFFRTVTDGVPPTSVSRFAVIDEGNCSPRFIRPTLHNIPQTNDILNNTGLVMGAIVQPLADLDPEDQPNTVPVVDFGTNGPIRCNRCRSYINPFVQFIEAGKRFVCNFCDCANEVPAWYMSNLDGMGRRRDIEERPELKFGSVDFVVSKEYIQKPPRPLTYIFVIDISTNSITQGIAAAAIKSIKAIAQEVAETHKNNKVGIITYAKTVHFYNPKGTHPQLMVVGDIDDVFVPFSHESLLTFGELAENDEFLDKLLLLAGSMQENENAMGSGMAAAQELLEPTGGRIILFASQMPAIGLGRLKPREDYKLYGSEKERGLYIPLIGFYKNVAPSLAKQQICVDTFLFPSSFIESATIGYLSSITNGHVHLYPNFNQSKDSARLYAQIRRNITRNSGYDAILKIRTSAGISIRRNLGHFNETTAEDMDLAGVDADSAFAVEFKHDSSLSEKQPVFLQSVLLYTNREGTRLLRVQTLKLPVAPNISQAFKFSDMDSLLNIVARFATIQVEKNRDPIPIVRESITSKAIQILAAYRKYCSAGSSQGQLILPESLKLLPIYFLGLNKSPAFRQGTDVLLDERIAYYNAIMKMNYSQILNFSYPRLFSLHDVEQQEGGEVYCLPPMLSLSSSRIDSTGVYLLDDGISTYVWVGRYAAPEVIQAIFQVPAVDSMTAETLLNPDPNTSLGLRIGQMLNELSINRVRFGQVRIFRDRDPSESQFFARLIEDRHSSSSVSYVDHLCELHKQIQNRMY